MQTPLRDEMKINVDDGLDSAWERSSMVSGMTGQNGDIISGHANPLMHL